MIEEDPESFDQVELIPGLCFGQNKEPQYHKGNDNGAAHQNEPAQFDSGAPGHDGKNHCVDHTHTHVAADTGNQSQHEGGVSSDLGDGKDRADVVAPLLKLMDLHGQKQNIRDFHHFVGLDQNGEAGKLQPVAVSAAGHTEGCEQQQQENDAESQQPLPVLLHKRLKVHIGTKDIDQDTQQDGDDLDGYLFIVVIVAGSGKNKGHAKAAGQQTQRQQQHIPFF